MRTKRQIEASRRNGRLSQGPGLEGREQSKKNAARHGLSGAGTVLPENMAEVVNARSADWTHALKPHHDIDEAFVRWISTDSVMLEGAHKYLVVQINLQAKAAREDWDADRYQQALDIASGLEADPPKVAERLRNFKQGAELLIERWEALEGLIGEEGGWGERQRGLALDLLGVHRDLRSGRTPLDPQEGESEAEAIRAVIAAELEALRGRVEGRLGEKDEDDRSAAELGYPGTESHGVKLAKRYLASITRRLAWAFGKLHAITARFIHPNDRSMFQLSSEFARMYQEIENLQKASKPKELGEPFSPRDLERIRALHEQMTEPSPAPAPPPVPVPVPEHSDLTALRAIPDPAPAPESAPAPEVAGEPIATEPYPPIPAFPASSAAVAPQSVDPRPPDPPG